MPYPVNQARRHQIPKARYRVSNWGEYDRALQERGSLTVWVTPEGTWQNWVTFLESKDEEGKSRRLVRSISVIKGSRRWFAGQRTY